MSATSMLWEITMLYHRIVESDKTKCIQYYYYWANKIVLKIYYCGTQYCKLFNGSFFAVTENIVANLLSNIISQIFLIPWWDWRTNDSKKYQIPRQFSDETVAGQPNPLYKFHINLIDGNNNRIEEDTKRFPGKSVDGPPSSLPSPDEITQLIDDSKRHFDDFSNDLEEFHGAVHMWTGGSIIRNGRPVSGHMSEISKAAFDPIFWSHHCMIDMLWWKWQQKHGVYNIPDHYRLMALEPFGLTVEQVLDIYELGYDYAGTQVSTDGNAEVKWFG